MEPVFHEIEHTADWALSVQGKDLADLFTHAAQGMVSLITDPNDLVEPNIARHLALEAPDTETLLVDWLSELTFLYETEGVLFSEFAITEIMPTRLKATIQGRRGVRVKKEIKAVTYHDLQVQQTTEGYRATVVFDV